uniref:Uncharacterized protein n=1 Tax=Leersia perrieri TaxID=77586 RepID=A0A0D9W0U8_9ORYZ
MSLGLTKAVQLGLTLYLVEPKGPFLEGPLSSPYFGSPQPIKTRSERKPNRTLRCTTLVPPRKHKVILVFVFIPRASTR